MKKQDLPDVSTKNTKEQILSAYMSALELLNKKEEPIQYAEKASRDKQVIEKVSQISPDSIMGDLGVLKSRIIRQLDGLSGDLLQEFTKLSDIRAGIALEQKHLEDMYGIKESAQTLAALLHARKENEQRLDEEMTQKRTEIDQYVATQKQLWKQSQEEFDRTQKESKEQLEKERLREEENYLYTRDMERRKEKDLYETAQAKEEQALKDRQQALDIREQDIKEREKLLNDLQKQITDQPKIIDASVKQAEERLESDLTQKFSFEKTLLQKDFEAQLSLKTQASESLLSRVKEQEALIRDLTQRSDLASKQVQDIACRALEASSKRFQETGIRNQESGNRAQDTGVRI